MKTKRAVLISFVLTVISLSAFLDAYEGWELVSDNNGIKIYSRPQPGSGVDEFKGTVVIPSKLEVLGEILRNVPGQPSWIADCARSEIIKKVDETTLITYSIFNAPWPVQNRDVVMKSVTSIDQKNRKFSIEVEALKNDILPPGNNMVRIRELKGNWIFEETGKDTVHVIYRMKINPGGSIPVWLANRTSRTSPYITLDNLRKLAASYSIDSNPSW